MPGEKSSQQNCRLPVLDADYEYDDEEDGVPYGYDPDPKPNPIPGSTRYQPIFRPGYTIVREEEEDEEESHAEEQDALSGLPVLEPQVDLEEHFRDVSASSVNSKVFKICIRPVRRRTLQLQNLSSKPSIDTVEFSFLDNKNICCGLCGEIVPYDQLIDDHLPKNHPTALRECNPTIQAIPYELWQKKLKAEQRSMQTGFKMTAYQSAARAPKSSKVTRRPRRNISLIRVNPRDMSIEQLEAALRRKMFEKLGRFVSVTLVDKIHARCGECAAIISLNKKFEIVHLVRHFNCWHPTKHLCAGTWPNRSPSKPGAKPLSLHDFAVVDAVTEMVDSLQCIWCGVFIEAAYLAQHFGEVHSDIIEIPKCNLCLQELILNARFQEKYALDFGITLPDEHHVDCGLCGAKFNHEMALDAHVQRRHIEGISVENDQSYDAESVQAEDADELVPETYANSRMILGKRRRPKRQFIQPQMRQAVPENSHFVQQLADSHWRCKLCGSNIFGAVISAAAIKHYKISHEEFREDLQYELCCARLQRVSNGCMKFISPQMISCILCDQSFTLHQAFNMCRAIRHLKAKHPNLMPEYASLMRKDGSGTPCFSQDDSYYEEPYVDPEGQVYFSGTPRTTEGLNDLDQIIEAMDIEGPVDGDGCQPMAFDPNQIVIKGVPYHAVANHVTSSMVVDNMPDGQSMYILMSEEEAKARGYIPEDALLLTPDIQLPNASQIHILGN